MKKIIFALFSIFAVGSAMAQMPDVKIENEKGETVSTAALVDGETPFIVSFWSTTCKPCIMELNNINDLFEDWQKEAKFRVITVSVDDSRSSAKAKAMANGNGWGENYTLLFDKNQNFKRALNVNLVPHVFVFDKNGKQIYSHTGYTPGSEIDLLNKIKALK